MISIVLPTQIRGSFGAKLLIIMVLLIFALSLLFNFFLIEIQRSSHHEHLANTGIAMAGMLAESIMVDVFAENVEGLKSPVDAIFHLDRVKGVAIFNHQKELLYHREKKDYLASFSSWQETFKRAGGTANFSIETQDALVLRQPISYNISSEDEEGMYFDNGGNKTVAQEIGFVALVFSTKREPEVIHSVLSQTIFSSLILFFSGVALTYLVVQRLTSPLSSLLRKVRASTDGQDQSDDINLLSKTFDSQFNELQVTFTTISKLKEELETKNRELTRDIKRRKELEETLRKRDHILAAINNATEKLLGSNEWVRFVVEMVDELGKVLNVGAIRISKHHVDTEGDITAHIKYEWVDEKVKAKIDPLKKKSFSYKKLGFKSWIECFQKGKMVIGNSCDMSPPVRTWLEDHSVKSLAFAPIMVEKDCWGTIGLAMFDREQSWSESVLDALQAAARIIASAVHREEISRELESQRAQLAHAGRLTAMGEMASGMAHEINQPLTVINLGADACSNYFSRNLPEAPEAEAAADICVQVKKIARIVENMRIFSRKSSEEMSPLNLSCTVLDALTFFRAQFREHLIDLKEEIAENLPEVKTDGQKFEQIVVNFLSNAKHAVLKRSEAEEGFRREIQVRLYRNSFSRDRLKSFGLKKKEFFAEQAIVFEVEDNGTGMSDVVKSRCLEPFYTTKEVGEGTGLGLSVSHSIIRQLGFHIEIESCENVGSLFRVIIPLRPGNHHE